MTRDSGTVIVLVSLAAMIAALGAYALSKGIDGTVLTAVVGAITAIAGFRVGKIWKGK